MLTQRAMPSVCLVAQPVVSGHRWVAGLWMPTDWFDEPARRALLLRHWQTGSSARRFALGDLLSFAKPLFMDCDRQEAWPLVAGDSGTKDGQGLSSAALSLGEAALAQGADVLVVMGGRPQPLRMHEGLALDPAEWLDTACLPCLDTIDWSDTVAPPQPIRVEARSIREVLNGKVGDAALVQRAFMQMLKERAARETSALSEGQGGQGASQVTSRSVVMLMLKLMVGLVAAVVLLSALASDQGREGDVALIIMLIAFLGFLLLFLKALRDMRREEKGQGRVQKPVPAQGGAGQPRRGGRSSSALKASAPATGLPERVKPISPSRWRALGARLAELTQLSRLLGMRQAQYLQRMMGMFEDGNLEEALRHAIPLGGEMSELPHALGTPTARQALDLRAGMSAHSSIGIGHDLQSHLRQVYRKTFEQLKRAQRIDEAVFVLAVLLNARSEALDYLESEGRFAQAAELALAWDQPPDVLVRLHCLAGDWRKAVAIGRRDGAFGSAVRQLEGKWPQAAQQLRGEWGEALAQQGLWIQAIDAVWPVSALRSKAVDWLTMAEGSGGELGAKALVQRAALLPDTLNQKAAVLVALRDEPGRHLERMAVAQALHTLGHKETGARMLTTLVLPMLLHDLARGAASLDKRSLQQLIDMSGDRFLQVDLPPNGVLPRSLPVTLKDRTEPLTVHAPDAGVHGIEDAVSLENGRWLLALGEAGVVLMDETGRWLHRFDVPAQSLVLAYSMQTALALSRRESLWRVSRIDVTSRTSRDLGMLRADAYARVFDGIAWTVARGRELFVLDTSQGLQDVLWHVDDLPGLVRGLVGDSKWEHVLMDPLPGEAPVSNSDPVLAEHWRYQLPTRRLAGRESVSVDRGVQPLLHPIHGMVMFKAQHDEEHSQRCTWWMPNGTADSRSVTHDFEAGTKALRGAWCGPDWLLVRVESGIGASLRLLDQRSGRELARIHWPTLARFRVRWCGAWVLITDDNGRLLQIDTLTGRVMGISVR